MFKELFKQKKTKNLFYSANTPPGPADSIFSKVDHDIYMLNYRKHVWFDLV